MECKIESRVSRKIVFIQFVMAIIVFMDHIGFGGNYEPISVLDEKGYYFGCWIVSTLTGVAVQLYMLLSAFLLYYNCDKTNTIKKFSRRIFTLIIPYVAWNIIYAVYTWLVEGKNIFHMDAIYQGFLVEPFDGPLWFLLTLISFLPLLFVLGPAKKWWQTILIVFGIILFLKCGIWDEVPILGWLCKQWSEHGKVYFTGVLLARICPQLFCKIRYNNIKVALVGIGILTLGLICSWHGLAFPRLLSAIMPIVYAVALWMAVPTELSDIALSNCWIKWISKKSFLIFAGHIMVARIIIRYIFALCIYPRRIYTGYEATFIKIMTQLAVFGCLCFVFIISEKLLPARILAILSGGREKDGGRTC